jgi:hypothetical protein
MLSNSLKCVSAAAFQWKVESILPMLSGRGGAALLRPCDFCASGRAGVVPVHTSGVGGCIPGVGLKRKWCRAGASRVLGRCNVS